MTETNPNKDNYERLLQGISELTYKDIYITSEVYSIADKMRENEGIAIAKIFRPQDWLRQEAEFIKLRFLSIDINIAFERNTNKRHITGGGMVTDVPRLRWKCGQRLIVDLMKIPEFDDKLDRDVQEMNYRQNIKLTSYATKAKAFFNQYGIIYHADISPTNVISIIKRILADEERNNMLL